LHSEHLQPQLQKEVSYQQDISITLDSCPDYRNVATASKEIDTEE